MNLKQLEAFVKVAETKSFSEAAKQLFLTQPTISAHVSALEKELNTCFLIRNTRGVELSESGKELYAYAVQMLEIEKTIKGRFGKEIKPDGNVLRIGASTVPAQYILPNVMSTFHAEYPGEKLKLFETDSKGVIDMILSHHIDIGFTGTVIEKGNCKYLPFYEDELVVLTPSNEKFVEKLCGGQILADWIMDEPVILREEGSGTKKEAVDLDLSVNLTYNNRTWEEGITHMNKQGELCSGNLRGFIQYRHLLPNNTSWSFDFEKRMELFK